MGGAGLERAGMSTWPQIVFIVTYAMGFTINLYRDYFGTLIAAVAIHSLLYAGGFYDVLL